MNHLHWYCQSNNQEIEHEKKHKLTKTIKVTMVKISKRSKEIYDKTEDK